MIGYRKKPTVLLHLEAEDRFVDGIIDACTPLGWRIVNTMNTSDHVPKGLVPVGAIIGGPVKPGSFSKLLQLKIPIVSTTSNPLSVEQKLPMVLSDVRAVARLAADTIMMRTRI